MAISTIVGLDWCAGLVDLIFFTKIIIFSDESHLPVRLHAAVYYLTCAIITSRTLLSCNLTLVD